MTGGDTIIPTAVDRSPFRSIVLLVLDSLRSDSFERAHTPTIDRLLARQERRHSYATWTLPSHGCLLAGLLPFPASHGRQAAAIYADDLRFWSTSFTGSPAHLDRFTPHFSLAEVARTSGFATFASMAMPVLNRHSSFVRGFDAYEDAAAHSLHFAAQAESALFNLCPDRPNFIFINSGDTHYPYLLPHAEMPRVSGLNGAVSFGEGGAPGHGFSADMLRAMHASQIEAAEQVDRRLESLIAELPKPLRIIITSDHGELFGEAGLFGHGPFAHPLLLDVPFAIGDIE